METYLTFVLANFELFIGLLILLTVALITSLMISAQNAKIERDNPVLPPKMYRRETFEYDGEQQLERALYRSNGR